MHLFLNNNYFQNYYDGTINKQFERICILHQYNPKKSKSIFLYL